MLVSHVQFRAVRNAGQRNETDQANDAIDQHGEHRGRALSRRFLEQVEDLYHVTPGAAGNEEVEEESNHDQRKDARPTQDDALDSKQHLPANGADDFDGAIHEGAEDEPERIRAHQRCDHFRALSGIAKNEIENRQRDRDLQRRERRLPLHARRRCLSVGAALMRRTS